MEGMDYETIGKITIAGILRENQKELRSQKPDKEGHIALKSEVTHVLKLDRGPPNSPCCTCQWYKGGIVICSGICCPKGLP